MARGRSLIHTRQSMMEKNISDSGSSTIMMHGTCKKIKFDSTLTEKKNPFLAIQYSGLD